MAGLYGAKGDIPRMVSAYIDLLAQNEGYIQSGQNALSRAIDFSADDERSEILRTELLRRIQRDPQRTVYPEQLIWRYIQQKDLNAAFVQSKAMDKGFDEGGVRLMELARIALANDDHATAFKCYEYVLSQRARLRLFSGIASHPGKEGFGSGMVITFSGPAQDTTEPAQAP